MPNLPMQQCGYAGCRTLSTATYCPTHMVLHKQEKKDSIKGGYSGKSYGYKWDKLSRQIRHNEPVCRVCKCRAAVAVDHIVPKAKGGTDALSNLQPICKTCHQTKSAADRRK